MKSQQGRYIIGKPDAPEPPDPRETSAAQTGTNVSTAIANSVMGAMNTYSPYGNQTFERTGEYSWTDPFTGEAYTVPTWDSTVTLNDQQQQTLDATQAAQTGLAELALDRTGFLRDYLPQTESMTDEIGNQLFEMGSLRLDPMFSQRRDALDAKLANQGIAPGSEAYNREIALLGQQENDAYNQLMLEGRGQAMDEINAPINQITALLSGSQVSSPGTRNWSPAQMPTTDNAGLINQNYNQRLANYQQEVAQRNGLMGGLFGLGAAGITGGLFG